MKKVHKRKNLKGLIFLALAFVILILVLFFAFRDSFSVLDKRVIYSKVIVSDHYGFDINNTALVFGMTKPGGGSSSKELMLTNGYSRDVVIDIYISGNISKFLSTPENEFILAQNMTKKVVFSVAIPSNTSYGTYDGNVIIVVKRR